MRRILSIFIILLYLLTPTFTVWALEENLLNKSQASERKRIKILAIDGGGIRGLIPVLILKNLESRLKNGKTLAESFDIMAGTSTGGIIVLLLNAQNPDGRPRYNMDDVLDMYKNLGADVFQTSIWQKLKSGWGWVDAKYSAESLENYLEEYLHEAELKDTVTNVIVPAYEIELDKTMFFRTVNAKDDPERNFKLKDVGRAITAAPTYFRPALIKDVTGKKNFTLIDGGISVNNPAISASVHAVELYGTNNDFLIVSLGTGTNYGATNKSIPREEVRTAGLIGWATKFIPLMMYAVNNVTDYQLKYIFTNSHPHKDYYRFQAILEPQNSDLDNVTVDNIKILEKHAYEIIERNNSDLQAIADVLNQD